MLARLHRAGELTYAFVPRADDEAMRDLTRAREDAKKAQRVAQQQLNGMLLRLGFRYPKDNWTKQHFLWFCRIRDAYARTTGGVPGIHQRYQ